MKLTLSQEIFKEYPIEFKEVNPIDFTQTTDLNGKITFKNQFSVDNDGKKIIIEPSDEGFINDEIQKNIDLKRKNTVVINAAVGQGKSYAILQTIDRLFSTKNLNDYFVIVATPFTSLVKQYYDDIKKLTFCKEKVYSYNSLQFDTNKEYLYKNIQVMTVNCLLENPGEKSFISSEIKREYINDLINKCELESKKVIFVFDEIHDSYFNFRQEYVFNLWKWQGILHKNFIISATYNEASKVVIKYLAELTDKTIKIIESKRTRIPSKQSKLFLHYSPEHNFTQNTKEIKSVINDLINRNKELDILCYSKKLSKKIANKNNELGKLIFEKYKGIQDCTSQSKRKKSNHYDEEKCNIGTNFKTGVNIEKKNHAYVIIAPPFSSRNMYPNADGIFLGGINSVIQALARQRNSGEIHIILPQPDYFDFTSLNNTLMNEIHKKYFKYVFNQIRPIYQKKYYNGKIAQYLSINNQNELLTDFYSNKLYSKVKKEIETVEQKDRTDLPQLNYPDFETFKLKNGENYLASTFAIFGEDLSSFITYSAITNQFINCQLEAIYKRTNIYFDDTDFKQQISAHYYENVNRYRRDLLLSVCNFKMYYSEVTRIFVEELESKYLVEKKDNTIEPKKITTSTKNKDFKLALLLFSVEEFYGKNYEYSNSSSIDRSEYIISNIKESKSINTSKFSENEKKRFEFFKVLEEYRTFLIDNIIDCGKFKYLPKKPNDSFSSNKKNKKNLFKVLDLLKHDDFFSDDSFILRRNIENKKKEDKKLESLYTILINCFFEVNPKRRKPKEKNSTERPEVNEILEIISLPKSNSIINTIKDVNFNEQYLEAILKYNDGIKTDDKEVEKIINSM